MEKRGVAVIILSVLMMILSLNLMPSSQIEDSLHLNIQTTNSTGIINGTFNFIFNISNTSDCANIIYTNSTSLTTDSRGIISYYLENVSLDYSNQYWLCYYRDGVLINASKIARTPYAFRTRNITLSGIEVDSNLDMGGYNTTTTGTGFFNFVSTTFNATASWFNGLFNWIIKNDASRSYLAFNGSDLSFNETQLNNTIDIRTTSIVQTVNTTGNIQNLINGTNMKFADVDFNNGWQSGGASIIGGDFLAKTIYVTNLSSLSVSTLNINGSFIPYFDNQFDLGNATNRWRNINISGILYGDWNGSSLYAPNTTLGIQALLNASGVYSIPLTINTTGNIGNLINNTISIISNLSINQYLILANASYLRTDNASYDSFNTTVNIQALINGSKINLVALGIGVSAPAYSLEIAKSATALNVSGNLYANTTTTWIMGGNVGIGKINPTNKLEVIGGGANGLLVDGATNSGVKINRLSTSYYSTLYFQTGGITDWNIQTRADLTDTKALVFRNASVANQMVIQQNGNIGFGVSAPAYSLEIAKSATALNVSGNLYANSTNVGIGTNSPVYKLDVDTNGGAVGALRLDSTPGQPSMLFDVGGANTAYMTGTNFSVGVSPGKLDYYLLTSAGAWSSNPVLHLEGNGNVGINTTSPGTLLTLSGGDTISVATPINDNYLCLTGGNACDYNVGGAIVFDGVNRTTAKGNLELYSGGTSGNITFYAGGSLRGVITKDGNMGIGTMSPGKALDVYPDTVSGCARIGRVSIGDWNACAAATVDFAMFSHYDQASATGYALLQSAAGTTLLNAPTGQTLNFRINNVDKMVLDTNGNVGINITNPTALLHVYGVEGNAFTAQGLIHLTNIGGGAGTGYLCYDGNGLITGSASCGSSEKIKENIKNLSLSGLDTINKLNPIEYNFKTESNSMSNNITAFDKPYAGFTAEEAGKISDLFVVYDDKGKISGLNYDAITATLVKGMQEQQNIIEVQNDTMNKLRDCIANSKDFAEMKVCANE